MKIVQVAHAVTYGDAASNQIIAMDEIFRKMGFTSEIYAEKIDLRITHNIKYYSELTPSSDQIFIFHFSTGTSFVKKVLKYPYPIVFYYHNITPAQFFIGDAWGSYFNSLKGRRQLKQLRNKVVFSWAASEYSRIELDCLGFKNTSVLPIILDIDLYNNFSLQESLIERYKDGFLNILTVGRVSPHKKQEDAIRILYYYKNFINKNVRLIIVGGQKASYVGKLKKMISLLNLNESVILTDKVSFDEMCTYYYIADLFLCCSEHEGFCVPLVESMLFGKPIFAYSAAAVPYTMGDSGVLFNDKNPAMVGEMIRYILGSDELKGIIIEAENRHLQRFSLGKIIPDLKRDILRIKELLKI